MAEKAHKASGEKPPQDVMGWLEYYLVKKAPVQLPVGAKDWIVRYMPWINVVILVILSPAILLALGIGVIALPFSALAGVGAATGLSIALAALVVEIILMIMALPGLFARKISGWNLTFYSVVASLAHSILVFNVFGGLVSAVIGAYVLFQIRSYYK